MNQPCELSVIIPAYQEAEHLHSTIMQINRFVRHATNNYEIILVDDGSTDKTWETVKRLRAALPQLRGFRLSRNFGKDAALSAGLAHCRGKAALVLDADLQHPPELIPQVYAAWKNEHFDIVEAVKTHRRHEQLYRRTASALFNWLFSKFTGLDLANSTDFKLLDRKVIQCWLQLKETKLFFRGLISWMGFRKKQIPFTVPPGARTGSQWSAASLARLALLALVAFSPTPLRVAHVVSALFTCFAFLLALQAFYLKLKGAALSGFTTVIIVLLLVGGLILFVLAIIGEYLVAIYEEIKARPRYLIAETLDDD